MNVDDGQIRKKTCTYKPKDQFVAPAPRDQWINVCGNQMQTHLRVQAFSAAYQRKPYGSRPKSRLGHNGHRHPKLMPMHYHDMSSQPKHQSSGDISFLLAEDDPPWKNVTSTLAVSPIKPCFTTRSFMATFSSSLRHSTWPEDLSNLP